MATSNTTGGGKLFFTPWTTDRQLRLPAAVPAGSTIFYPGQALLRDASGNVTQCDDTQRGEFLGILMDLVRVQVDPVDAVQVNGLLGDKMLDIVQPLLFVAEIAAAAAGDEGRKVYWQFNTTVSYSPGNNANFAGQVWWVKDATHVLVAPPWMIADLLGGKATMTVAGAGTVALTKFDAGKTILIPSASAQTVTLPSAVKLGSGDQIIFIQTGTAGAVATLTAAGTDTINGTAAWGASTLALGTTRGSRAVLQSDGMSQWYVVG